MRRSPACVVLLVSGLWGLASASGCATTAQGVRKERGPTIRFQVGETRQPARLVLEVDPRRRPIGPATLHTFTFTLEEKITSVEGGEAQFEARFIDVVGASGEPQLSDQLALAMDDLKVSFRETARGEVRDLKIERLRPPLDATTAHAIVATLFSAERGPRLPDHPVVLQDDWTVEADSELVGITAHRRTFYTLVGQTEQDLQLREKGHVEGIATVNGARRSLNGDTYSLESIDLAGGKVVSGEYEWTVRVEDEPPSSSEVPGVGKTRVRAERGKTAERPTRR